MKPYEQLTAKGQAIRLRRLAERVLAAYGLAEARLTYLRNGENATFRVDAEPAPRSAASRRNGPEPSPPRDGRYVPNRYLLRVHNPVHKTGEKFASEMTWLEALRRDLDAPVPEPLRTTDGELCALVDAPGFAAPRACTMMRWLAGRNHAKRPTPAHLRALGAMTASLHQHAATWKPPAGFRRKRWDWEGHFGANTDFDHPSGEVWAMLPPECAPAFREVSERARRAFAAIEKRDGGFPLLHGDLHLGNVVHAGGEARVYDFDDCGYAPLAHDLAVVSVFLSGYREPKPERWDAFLDGYASRRTLSSDALRDLPLMEAVRLTTVAMWAISKARVNPGFRRFADRYVPIALAKTNAYLEGA